MYIPFLSDVFSDDRTGITYSYRTINDTSYPSCEVEFLVDHTYLLYPAIIDSGADVSLLPQKMGLDFGLKKTQLRYLGGVGGRTGYYLNYINVKIATKKLTVPVAWMTSDDIPLLLGRKGVFEKFKICFNEKENKVTFI